MKNNIIKQKRKNFRLFSSVMEIPFEEMPKDNEVYKIITNGSFSSASIILFISQKTKIKSLFCSTLRIGKNELKMLIGLKNMDKLEYCNFIVGSIMSDDKKQKKYGYFDDFTKVFDDNGWDYMVKRNHSKIFLIDTEIGSYVIETSSNFNENPKIEQFSIEKSDELYRFYKENVFEK